MATLERAVRIAATAHAGTKDKGGEPYLLHALRVMLAVRTPHERMAAVLHDVVEDCNPPWTLEKLAQKGFPAEVLRAVEALTKRPGETRLAAASRAAADPVALRVKLADVADNLDLGRITNLTINDFERIIEYRQVHAELMLSLGSTR